MLFRSDQDEALALEACLGETLCSFSISDMMREGVIVPTKVFFYPVASKRLGSRNKFHSIYRKGVVDCEERNAMIVWAARSLVDQGRKVLILVHQIKHGQFLEKRIEGSVFIQGSDGDRVRAMTKELDAGKIRCVIGSPVIGEGLDIPLADAIIYAKGMKAQVTNTQDIFRVRTKLGEKTDAVIVDFADRHCDMLLDHSVDRLRNYMDAKCEIFFIDV